MKTLLGKLIGLARAAEGNEDLLNAGTAALFAEALTRPDSTTAEKLTAEKRRLVPDCFVCQHPCGRTDDADTAFLAGEPNDVRAAKDRLLDRAKALCLPDIPSEEALRRICTILQLIGLEGLDAGYLSEMTE